MLVTVKCEITLEERETGKILYHADNFVFRNQYEISTDVKSFFEEQDPALDRLAQDFAARLVAAVTENYWLRRFRRKNWWHGWREERRLRAFCCWGRDRIFGITSAR